MRTMTGIPIWVRVSGIIALALVAVVVGSMLLAGASAQMERMDHNVGPTGSAAPAASVTPPHVRPSH